MTGPLQKSKKIAKVQNGEKKINKKASISINGNKEEKKSHGY